MKIRTLCKKKLFRRSNELDLLCLWWGWSMSWNTLWWSSSWHKRWEQFQKKIELDLLILCWWWARSSWKSLLDCHPQPFGCLCTGAVGKTNNKGIKIQIWTSQLDVYLWATLPKCWFDILIGNRWVSPWIRHQEYQPYRFMQEVRIRCNLFETTQICKL